MVSTIIKLEGFVIDNSFWKADMQEYYSHEESYFVSKYLGRTNIEHYLCKLSIRVTTSVPHVELFMNVKINTVQSHSNTENVCYVIPAIHDYAEFCAYFNI